VTAKENEKKLVRRRRKRRRRKAFKSVSLFPLLTRLFLTRHLSAEVITAARVKDANQEDPWVRAKVRVGVRDSQF
jgi:hypothetical protein